MDKDTHVVAVNESGKTTFYNLGGYVQYMPYDLAVEKAEEWAAKNPGQEVFILKAIAVSLVSKSTTRKL